MVEKLAPDPLMKNQNWAYLWINRLKCCKVCFCLHPSWYLPKYNKTKVLMSYFCLIWSFFKEQKELGSDKKLYEIFPSKYKSFMRFTDSKNITFSEEIIHAELNDFFTGVFIVRIFLYQWPRKHFHV